MNSYQRARTFAIEVQVTDMVLFLGPLDALGVLRVERPRQSVLRIIGDMQRVFKVFRLNHRQHRSENLLLGDACMWVYIGKHGWLDKVARAMMTTACHEATLVLAYLDIVGDLLHSVLIYDRSHVGIRLCDIA